MRISGVSVKRAVWVGMAAVLVAGAAAVRRDAVVAAGSDVRRPVLVELFTSEGCSSCPPADALLAKLDKMQPVAGARVIVLSEHVTYWNSLGWRDPFSLDAATERQRRYGEQFGLNEVYTPQAVVDGGTELVGSDERGMTRAVERAAADAKEELAIGDAQVGGGVVRFTVRGAGDERRVLMAAVAEDAVESQVLRGENEGRRLRHVAVVRVIQEMGKGADDGRALELKLPAQSHPGALRLVVFVVRRGDGRVVGVVERSVGGE